MPSETSEVVNFVTTDAITGRNIGFSPHVSYETTGSQFGFKLREVSHCPEKRLK